MFGPQDSLPPLLPPISELTASDRPGAGAPLSLRASTSQYRPRASREGALPAPGRLESLTPEGTPPPQHTSAQARAARRPHRGMSSSGSRRGSVQCLRGAPDPKVPGLEEGKTPDPGALAVPTRRSRERAGARLWSVAKALLRQTPERDAVREKEPRRASLALPSRRERAAKGCR